MSRTCCRSHRLIELGHPPVFAVTVGTQHAQVGVAVYQKFVTEALENGSLKCKPDPLVVGKGLESIDHGLDVQQKGVSFKKVVVTIA